MDKMQEALGILEKFKDKCVDKEFEEQRKIIEEEIKMDNLLPKDHPEYVKLMAFLDWLSKGGSVADKIKIRFYTPSFRGVHARRRIRKNESFLFTPKSQIITLEMAKATPIGKKMEEAKIKLLSPKHSFLSSYVLQEKRKPDSFWKPYLDILPNTCNNFPIFFTAEEKEWLKGSPFLDQVEEKISDMDQDYTSICDAVPEFKQFPQVEFNTIRMLVSSRIFGICIEGVKTDALVPYAGMI